MNSSIPFVCMHIYEGVYGRVSPQMGNKSELQEPRGSGTDGMKVLTSANCLRRNPVRSIFIALYYTNKKCFLTG